METHDEEQVEEAPPGWVLRTPTRPFEVWALPLLSLAAAVMVIAVGTRSSDALILVAGVVTGAVLAVAAPLLFLAAHRAYGQQTWGASWDLHRTRVLIGVVTGVTLMVGSLVIGLPIAATLGVIGGFAQTSRYARSVPRFDLSAVAWAFLGVVASCTVLVVLGLVLPEGPVLPGWRASVWVGGGISGALFGAVLALVHARRAGHAPRY